MTGNMLPCRRSPCVCGDGWFTLTSAHCAASPSPLPLGLTSQTRARLWLLKPAVIHTHYTVNHQPKTHSCRLVLKRLAVLRCSIRDGLNRYCPLCTMSKKAPPMRFVDGGGCLFTLTHDGMTTVSEYNIKGYSKKILNGI